MKSRLTRWLPPIPLILPAAVSGVLVTLSFPNISAGPLSFVALVPLLAAVMRRRPNRGDAFRTGFVFGSACYFTMLWWIVKLIPSADVTIPWLMMPALLILVLYLSLYPAFFVLLLSAVTRWSLWRVLVAAPSLWVLLEAVRSRGELAFPWGSLGYTLSYHPPLIQWASVGGLPALSLAVMAVNVLFAAALVARGTVRRAALAIGAFAVVGLMWGHGQSMVRAQPEPTEPFRIAVVQPNVDLVVKWLPEFKDSTLRLIERLANEAAATGAELIVFPETSAPVYIEHNPDYKPKLQAIASATGVPIYIGFLDHRFDGPDREINIYNSSGLFLPDGRIEKYDKNHLLPFGESLPLSSRFRWLRKINFGQSNFQHGPARGPLDAGVAKLTPLICFESVFPYLCSRGVAGGTQLLVNITNDGWFSDTPGPYQHAQMCILRSVEFRRYLVRSANTGVSMVVSPAGEIIDEVGLYTSGTIVASVAALGGKTVYARFGDWPVLIVCMLLSLAAVFIPRAAGES